MMKVTAIIQARVGSTRLRGKVLKKINGKEIILHLLDRLSSSKKISKIIIAIPNTKENDKLCHLLKKNNFLIFRGSERNVLNRYYECAKKFKSNHILRITGDCPLIDPKLVDELIKKYQASKVDYASNVINRTFPDGMDMEIFSFKSLKIANENVILKKD
ncbi:NTP transferase domain-containing protein, partial [Candidatus Pelagibacter sp.]|nr:NTP transferase domain-containing protein [Candidatus Pelagibacter sp.]